LIVEADRAVAWTQPEDIPFNGGLPPRLGHMFDGGFNALMADGSTRWVQQSALNNEQLRAAIVSDGPSPPVPHPRAPTPTSHPPEAPMTISVTCDGCDRTLKAPDTSAGRKIKCPKCGAAVLVPSPDEDEAEPVAAKKSAAPAKAKRMSASDGP